MEYCRLGRTDLQVSRVGLGAMRIVGPDCPEEKALAIVHKAIDLGINYIDTAPVYGPLFGGYAGESEERLGKALKGISSDKVMVASKYSPNRVGGLNTDPQAMIDTVEGSLSRIGRDCLDVLLLHSILSEDYELVMETVYPVAVKLREQGKCRNIGISERVRVDVSNEMAAKAIPSDHFDMILMKYTVMNQMAGEKLFPLAEEHDVGIALLSAVTPMSSGVVNRPEVIAEMRKRMGLRGSEGHPLDFLVQGDLANLFEAGARFCASHPTVDLILCGATSTEILESSVKSVLGAPLPDEHLARLAPLSSLEIDLLAEGIIDEPIF